MGVYKRVRRNDNMHLLSIRLKTLVSFLCVVLMIFAYFSMSKKADNNQIVKARDDFKLYNIEHSINRVKNLKNQQKPRGNCCLSHRKQSVKSPFTSSCGRNCEQFGTVYGGRKLPKILCGLQPNLTIFSFGCGEDISFDVAMAATFDANIFLFDPTPRATIHVKSVLRALQTRRLPEKAKGIDKYIAIDNREHEISGGVDALSWFGRVVSSTAEARQISYMSAALGDVDSNMTFIEPLAGVSNFLDESGDLDTSKGRSKITVPVYTLETLMSKTGTQIVDILKIDIEGYEIKVIPKLIELFKSWPKRKWPKVLMFDMDSLLPKHEKRDIPAGQRMVKLISDNGYNIFAGGQGVVDYTFVLNDKDIAIGCEDETTF